jgi:hypothetical protein
MATPLRPDPIEMRRALHLLRPDPGQVTELRVLEAKTRNSYRSCTFSGYFNDEEAFVREACRPEAAKGYYWFFRESVR